jgi:hypothetical protein
MKATPLPVTDVVAADEPPTELNKRREMIKAAVNAAANGVMTDIKALRAQLDELETLVLQSAERNIESLNTHVGICESAQIEVNRLSGVVAEMRKTQIDNGSERKGGLNGFSAEVG